MLHADEKGKMGVKVELWAAEADGSGAFEGSGAVGQWGGAQV
jgi:hypothetical protein